MRVKAVANVTGNENNLSYSIGDIITVENTDDEIWWLGTDANGKLGYFEKKNVVELSSTYG